MNFYPQQFLLVGIILFFAPATLTSQTCPTPTNLTILSSSSVTASFSWTGSGQAGTLYHWEIGLPGFIPGNNQFILRDSTTDTLGFALGLVSSTVLQLSVKAVCLNGGISNWSLPITFATDPGCNEEYTDPGGPLGNYQNSVSDTALICPASDSEVVKLTFLTFATEQNGDFLKIYDGTDASAPLLGNLSGIYLPPLDTLPGPFIATNSSGCLYILFFSNGQTNYEGWTAFVNCVTPDSCFGPANLSVDSIGATSATISWTGLFGADMFEWELGIAPFDTSGTPIQNDTTSTDTLLLNNLSSHTDYVLLVRSRCDSVSYSDWISITFSTPISCGDTLFDTGGPDMEYMSDENYSTTICPDSAQHTVTLTFLEFMTQNLQDVLIIYDGTSISAPLIGAYAGNSLPPPATATNASGCLTVQFVSNGNGNDDGWAALISCDTATECFDLLDLNLVHVESDSAAVSWTGIFGAMGYVWELDTLTFIPGTGAALLSDTVSTNALNLGQLESGQTYVLYVKTKCASDTSAWFGPLEFVTPPGCGDQFYDSGGASGEYTPDEDQTTVICPDVPGEVVTLTFTDFETNIGDVLTIYNGDSINPLLILGTLNGNPPTPAPFIATTANGCLTAHFISDGNNEKSGWEANVTCAPPADCNEVLLLHVDSIGGSTVNASWVAMAGAVGYEWKIGPVPYSPLSGPALDSGLVATTAVFIAGLQQFTTYDLWVRTLCAGDTSEFQKVTFTTTVNCFSSAKLLKCNEPAQAISLGIGVWALNCTAPPVIDLGQENVFQFTAPVTRTYRLAITQVTTGNFADFYYKEAADGCNADNWNCFGGGNGNDTLTLGPLTAGVQYLILVDPQLPTVAVTRFIVFDCAPLNEDATGAITLIVNDACTGNVHANGTAGFSTGEPDPDAETDGVTDNIAGRWLTPADHTVWFKFDAPASGTVTISTDQIPLGDNYDSQVALYSAVDPGNYATFRYIESDEDNGTAANGLSAVLYYTGLTPGQTYYVQVDGFGTSSGTFCIEVIDGIYRFHDGNCIETYTVAGVNGTTPSGDRWYGIYGGQDALDQGKLIAAIKPGNQNLDSVFCQFMVYTDTIPVATNGIPYMPAYFNFRSSVAPVSPVELRLFFYNYELEALKLRTQLFNNSAENLVVSHYTGANQDCSPAQHGAIDVVLLDTSAVQSVNTTGTASFYLQFATTLPKLGEFGAHFGLVALPIELKSFTGLVYPDFNRLNWVTTLEKGVQWHIVERSPDGVNWSEIGRVRGRVQSYTEQPYQMDDHRPLPQAFYRLRTLDFDGTQQVSDAIMLIREADRLEVLNTFPSPTFGNLTVQYISPSENTSALRMFDLNGRLVLEQTMVAAKGLNVKTLDVSYLQPGVYTLILTGEHDATTPVRVVRQ